MTSAPRIEIFSDLNCAWCYFDHGAIKRLTDAYAIEIVWRAFPLHPDIPDEGLSIETLFGHNRSLMTAKIEQLEKKAASLGLPFAKRSTISNSRLGQELFKWAEAQGKTEAFHDAIYRAYFAQGLNIAQHSVLLDAAVAAGLDRDEARSVLEGRSFSQAVDDDWKLSEKLDIMVAPTYILNQQRLAGSQTYERLENLLQRNGVEKG